jgi:protein-S-isoprenylcysteine O-methyltransferase Ste14
MTSRSLIFVILQLCLFLVFAAIPAGYAAVFAWQLTAFILVITGAIITAIAMFQLGPGLTPFPVPRSGGNLITGGIYRWVRHPIYSALLLITAGITIYSLNVPRALVTLLLIILFYYKSQYEESLLEQKFSGYSDYRSGTGRFFPLLFRKR